MTGVFGKIRSAFRFSARDCIVTVLCLAVASALCAVLHVFSDSDSYAPLIFVLAVLMISRFTDGYVLGLFSSVFAVLAVNYIFTYPYFELDFSLTGYPLTFLCSVFRYANLPNLRLYGCTIAVRQLSYLPGQTHIFVNRFVGCVYHNRRKPKLQCLFNARKRLAVVQVYSHRHGSILCCRHHHWSNHRKRRIRQSDLCHLKNQWRAQFLRRTYGT